MGPAASQVAIKQTGTNGGGYMGVNSAHPLENPNAFTNLIEMISILLIPAALCFTFGSAVKNKKQGIAIFTAMFLCLVVALGCIAVTEQAGTSQLAQNGAVNMLSLIHISGRRSDWYFQSETPSSFLLLSVSLPASFKMGIKKRHRFFEPTAFLAIFTIPNFPATRQKISWRRGSHFLCGRF